MRRLDLVKKILSCGSDDSGILIEKSNDDVCRISSGQMKSAIFEYHSIEDIKMVNNTIVIHISEKGL